MVGLPWAAESCPWVGKLRTVLPLSDVIRDSAVQLGLTQGVGCSRGAEECKGGSVPCAASASMVLPSGHTSTDVMRPCGRRRSIGSGLGMVGWMVDRQEHLGAHQHRRHEALRAPAFNRVRVRYGRVDGWTGRSISGDCRVRWRIALLEEG